MQTILGYGGIGRPLAEALAPFTDHVRCVSRTPRPLPAAPGTRYEHRTADLLDADATRAAVAGSSVVYLTAGLPYRTKIWQRDWPVLTANVIEALRLEVAGADAGAKGEGKYQAPLPRLVFFDNVYALPATAQRGFPEDSPLTATTAKGKVRAAVLEQLRAGAAAGYYDLVVARSADFYGPDAANSLFEELIAQPIRQGGTPRWLGDPDRLHAFTYAPDAARATALLGNAPRAAGQTWNLPTAPAATLHAWAGYVSGKDTPVTVSRIPRFVWHALGWFNADLRELHDIRGQVLADYALDSGKFERTFGWSATAPAAVMTTEAAVDKV